jgi:hypothetical protein
MATASLREPDGLLGEGVSAPPVTTSQPLCVKCGERPRLGALRRCKVCLKSDADADRQSRADAEARVEARAEAAAPVASPPLPAKVKDLTGLRCGKLVAVEFVWMPNGKARTAAWRCTCDCGNSTVVRAGNLLGGEQKGCRCVTRSHGQSDTPEYVAWQSMRRRCANPRTTSYEHYGGRGIRVCKRWRKFEDFLADMGPRPSPEHSIDRYPDKDGDYEPGNVRWATRTEQARNTRVNRLITHDGQTLTVTEWSERTRIGASTIGERLRHGWSASDAITTPPQPRARKRGAISHDGRTMPVAAWSREVGLNSNTIRERLARGWSPSDALTRPCQGRRCREGARSGRNLPLKRTAPVRFAKAPKTG